VPLFSPWGKQLALQEDNMAARQTSSRTLKSIAGAGIFALGLLLLFVNLDGVAAQISYAVGAPAQAPQILPAIGLMGLHALQAYTFDHAGFLPTLVQMLVSFWPVILIAIGAALLRGSFSRRPAKSVVVAAYSGQRTSL
jgi:hypothetical protein